MNEDERRALGLFRLGNSTWDIAKRMNITEADAVRLLASARQKRRQEKTEK